MRLRSAKGVGSKCGEGGGKTASTRSRFISKAAAGRLKAAAQNLRECFDDTDSSSLRRQAMETNTILEFPENRGLKALRSRGREAVAVSSAHVGRAS